ncbi:MAG: RNA polymerase sigma factor [Myxococcota bacterium]
MPNHVTGEIEALQRAARAGEEGALAELCDHLQPLIFRLCMRMLGDPLDAEDACQDVLLKVVRHLPEFEGRSQLTTWVYTLAVRHLGALRRKRSERRAFGELGLAASLQFGLAIDAARPSPDDEVLAREVKLACTQGMLMRLTREERLAIVLVDLFDLPGPEAAAIAGVTAVTLRKRLSRARQRLGGFLVNRCGLVNEQANCQCRRQISATQLLAPLRRKPVLREVFEEVPDATLRAAHHELRQVRAIASAFGRDRVQAPDALRARLSRWLPTILG